MKIHFHKWLKRRFLFGFTSIFGDYVRVYECVCSKCGKTSVREYR